MTEIAQLKTCAQKQRIGDACNDRGPYYKVPFIFGQEPRMAMEWWCESCVDDGPEFERDGDDVYMTDQDGNRLAEAEEIEEAYKDGTDKMIELLDWD